MKKNERISAEAMRRKQKRAERMKPRRSRRKRLRRLELEHGRRQAAKKKVRK